MAKTPTKRQIVVQFEDGSSLYGSSFEGPFTYAKLKQVLPFIHKPIEAITAPFIYEEEE